MTVTAVVTINLTLDYLSPIIKVFQKKITMTASNLTAQQISASLEDKEGELRLDSRIVADGFGIKSHKDYRHDILEKYEKQFAELGVVLTHPRKPLDVNSSGFLLS